MATGEYRSPLRHHMGRFQGAARELRLAHIEDVERRHAVVLERVRADLAREGRKQ